MWISLPVRCAERKGKRIIREEMLLHWNYLSFIHVKVPVPLSVKSCEQEIVLLATRGNEIACLVVLCQKKTEFLGFRLAPGQCRHLTRRLFTPNRAFILDRCD